MLRPRHFRSPQQNNTRPPFPKSYDTKQFHCFEVGSQMKLIIDCNIYLVVMHSLQTLLGSHEHHQMPLQGIAPKQVQPHHTSVQDDMYIQTHTAMRQSDKGGVGQWSNGRLALSISNNASVKSALLFMLAALL
jgi:hypothetical protein